MRDNIFDSQYYADEKSKKIQRRLVITLYSLPQSEHALLHICFQPQNRLEHLAFGKMRTADLRISGWYNW